MDYKKEAVLLVAPPYLGIYKDLVTQMEILGYDVDYITSKVDEKDPFFIFRPLNKYLYSKKSFLNKLESFWNTTLQEDRYKKSYDFLVVLNGTFVHKVLFDTLKKRNNDLKSINYLIDSMKVYRFERNFPYYDKVYTFNREDAIRYDLELLPTYWIPDDPAQKTFDTDEKLCVFAFGGFKYDRYLIFKRISDITHQLGCSAFIKVVIPACNGLKARIKNSLKLFIHLGRFKLDQDIITTNPLPTEIFRGYISNSRIVVDTILDKQDGITSRMMWAIGMGKKVITNNKSIRFYPFYNEARFFIVDSNRFFIPKSFFEDLYVETREERTIIDAFRIDNWVIKLLS